MEAFIIICCAFGAGLTCGILLMGGLELLENRRQDAELRELDRKRREFLYGPENVVNSRPFKKLQPGEGEPLAPKETGHGFNPGRSNGNVPARKKRS